ncbi:MAG: hypothetical protein LBL07_20165 [Tannerella sp.]|jgi:hypothetical protein|nr:hypothetical protein [Tannerella sp.]
MNKEINMGAPIRKTVKEQQISVKGFAEKSGKGRGTVYIKEIFSGIFIEMLERLVRLFSTVTICPNRETLSTAYSDVALLQETASKDPLAPVCQTLFQLGKNNLDRFGNLPVASDTVKFPDVNFAFTYYNGSRPILSGEN